MVSCTIHSRSLVELMGKIFWRMLVKPYLCILVLQTILLFIVSSCAEIGFPHALDVESPALDAPSACPPRVHVHQSGHC